jgi:hypothetical protein
VAWKIIDSLENASPKCNPEDFEKNLKSVRKHMRALAPILSWFLFDAGIYERRRLRELLGEDFVNFGSLVMAMGGEIAREDLVSSRQVLDLRKR